jgi:cysteine desulfurase/selenocysteine lyase
MRANVHRGIFKEAVEATARYEDARKKVAEFIGALPHEIIFTSGATESSNILLRMIDESIKFSDVEHEIVTTAMEHHSAFVPLQQLAGRRSLPLHMIPLQGIALDYGKGEELITKKTALLSVILASNVTGTVNDVARLAHYAHSKGDAIVVVDATAAMGHIPVNIHDLDCDALFFSGHKMFAPTGIGILWVRNALLQKLSPASFGGHMVAHVDAQASTWAPIPERFEAGTKNISGAIGLGSAIDYINAIGFTDIHPSIQKLVSYAISALDNIPGVTVVSERDTEKNIGIVSFICDFAHPHDVAEILARDGVAVRPGHHCAIPLHTALGISSTVRASFHVYNTKEDIDALILAIKKAKEVFGRE